MFACKQEPSDENEQEGQHAYFIVSFIAFRTTFAIDALPRVCLDNRQHFTRAIETSGMKMMMTTGTYHQFIVMGRIDGFTRVTHVDRMTVRRDRCRRFDRTRRGTTQAIE